MYYCTGVHLFKIHSTHIQMAHPQVYNVGVVSFIILDTVWKHKQYMLHKPTDALSIYVKLIVMHYLEHYVASYQGE